MLMVGALAASRSVRIPSTRSPGPRSRVFHSTLQHQTFMNRSSSQPGPRQAESGRHAGGDSDRDVPTHRPLERFWPYVDVPEDPSDEELASLDPDLFEALFGAVPRPFSITLVFPRLDSIDYEAAVELARNASQYRETGSGDALRHRARFWSSDARKLRELFEIVGRFDECEVLIDDRPVPYARELWLPLVWLLIR
jgi:hypothetical protein